ncbi:MULTISPECIES: sensor histidine kinase [Leptolyngbya]|uniref:sensor histidine kinase n=1 Tax=Leptolyngbya TaxID=47251 RepID=UPI00168A11E6|nr:CHASE2 domain-containing protein [Leptolyngbya sp. FACHB-1624]MBD1855490.1 CHASE2 domain-containing protein [Leptolyngbya sp. FACHB-1624]
MTRIDQRLLNELKTWRSAAIPGLFVITLIILTRAFGGLQSLEWMAYDGLMRHRPSEAMDERVVVVAIDDEDINQIKTYPIPDQELAAAITKLQSYRPSAIGLDLFRDLPAEPGHQELLQVFQTYPNLFAIEQLPFDKTITIQAPKNVSPNQIGFANSMPLDQDGNVRRHILGATDPRYINAADAADHYKFSLATQLALRYLKPKGYEPESGKFDSNALRLGTTEFPRVQSSTGGYINVDDGGTQVLINYRTGINPFRVLSLRDVRQNKVKPEWIRDKVVLIGSSAIGVKDFANVAAIPVEDSTIYPGVKVHAHAVSQILAAVLDGRLLLKTWADFAEYGWIVLWGILGISVGRRLQAPWQILLVVAIVGIGLIGICYGLLLAGWWVPLIPALMVFVLNGAGLSAGLLYRTKQSLEAQEKLRQAELEQIFNSIHNSPLQRLSLILRGLKDHSNPPKALIQQLDELDKELRSVHQDIGRMTQNQAERIRLGDDLFSLTIPLNELLQIVCDVTLQRTSQFPAFKDVKVRLIEICSDPERMILDQGLTLAQKDWICRFLEEALCNIGKHGQNVTQIQVFCGQEYQYQVIRVIDNGDHQKQTRTGIGTKAANNLARQLRGKFQRVTNSPRGVICELKWRTKKA